MQTALMLLNVGLLLGSSLVLWSLWRRGAAHFASIQASLPVADASPRPARDLLAELESATRDTQRRLAQARQHLDRVRGAFEAGLGDGRPR